VLASHSILQSVKARFSSASSFTRRVKYSSILSSVRFRVCSYPHFNLTNPIPSAERVHAVNPGVPRLRSTAYRICLVFLTGYLVIFVLMIWGRVSFLRDGTFHYFPYTNATMDGSDNACVIGLVTPSCVLLPLLHTPPVLKFLSHSSLALLIYDLILNVLFTWCVTFLSTVLFAYLRPSTFQPIFAPPLPFFLQAHPPPPTPCQAYSRRCSCCSYHIRRKHSRPYSHARPTVGLGLSRLLRHRCDRQRTRVVLCHQFHG